MRVPTPDGELPWDYAWWREPGAGNALLMVADDRRSLFCSSLRVDGTDARFDPPRPVTTLPDAHVLDLAPLSEGRALLMLQDPAEEQVERIEVVIGALAELGPTR